VRLAAASRAEAEGDAALAAALRGRNSSLLRKQHLFKLCAWWGYASYVWEPTSAPEPSASRVRSRGRWRQLAASAAAAADDATAVLLVPRVRPLDEMPPALEPELRGALTSYLASLSNVRVFASGVAEPHAPSQLLLPAAMRPFLQPLSASVAAVQADAAAICAYSAALAASDAADVPLWLAPQAEVPLRCERHVAFLQSIVIANGAGVRHFQAMAAAGGVSSGPDAAVMATVFDDFMEMRTLAGRFEASLVTLRAASSAARYAAASALVTSFVASILAGIRRSLEEKIAWAEGRTAAAPPPAVLHPSTAHLHRHFRAQCLPMVQSICPVAGQCLTAALDVTLASAPQEVFGAATAHDGAAATGTAAS
jgi:hypothetical protein